MTEFVQPMTVKDLIEHLQAMPQDLPVIYQRYSEYRLLDKRDISVEEQCTLRSDGWVHRFRPDKPKQLYLVFPGN